MVFNEESLKLNSVNVNRNNQPEKQKKNVSVKPNKTHKPMILHESEDRNNSFNPEK